LTRAVQPPAREKLISRVNMRARALVSPRGGALRRKDEEKYPPRPVAVLSVVEVEAVYSPGSTLGTSLGPAGPPWMRDLISGWLIRPVFGFISCFKSASYPGAPERAGEVVAALDLRKVVPAPGRIYASLVKSELTFPDPSELATNPDGPNEKEVLQSWRAIWKTNYADWLTPDDSGGLLRTVASGFENCDPMLSKLSAFRDGAFGRTYESCTTKMKRAPKASATTSTSRLCARPGEEYASVKGCFNGDGQLIHRSDSHRHFCLLGQPAEIENCRVWPELISINGYVGCLAPFNLVGDCDQRTAAEAIGVRGRDNALLSSARTLASKGCWQQLKPAEIGCPAFGLEHRHK
jgi:hypothetical protein